MNSSIAISAEDVLHHLKIACQVTEVIEGIVNRKIIKETAEKEGIKIELEEIQQAADNLRLANNLYKADQTWSWLRKNYLSLDDFEELAYANLLSSKLATHLFAERAEALFYQHPLDYAGAVTYEVVLDDEDLAMELFYCLQEGETSFQEIARQYIQEPEIRRVGGYRGIRRRSDYRPEIAAVVFAANPPQILKPIVAPKGVHLILVEEIIKPEFNEILRTQIIAELFSNWLKQQAAELQIVASLDSGAGIEPSKDKLTQG